MDLQWNKIWQHCVLHLHVACTVPLSLVELSWAVALDEHNYQDNMQNAKVEIHNLIKGMKCPKKNTAFHCMQPSLVHFLGPVAGTAIQTS